MKLTDTYTKSMKEIIEECDIVNQKIHTDDDGNIEAIEIKYRPHDHFAPPKKSGYNLGGH